MDSITVIIVNWNGGSLLDECLACLKQQSHPASRILVMDNGSSDDSAQRARKIPGVEVHFLGANLGFAAANNRAIHLCDSEFIALLNPDAFADKDWLLNLAKATEAHPEIAAFGSRQMIQGTASTIDGLGDVYHCSGLVWRKGHGRPENRADHVAAPIFSPCACAALYRREALIDVGGFDEDYFCYVEDVDLGFRLQLAGYQALYVPDAIVHHMGSASTGGQHSNFSVYHGHRNLVWTFLKNMPGFLFWLLLPAHILLNFASAIHFSRRGQGKVILKAKWDAMKGIPKMWKKRLKIQSDRKVSISYVWQILDKRLMLSNKH